MLSARRSPTLLAALSNCSNSSFSPYARSISFDCRFTFVLLFFLLVLSLWFLFCAAQLKKLTLLITFNIDATDNGLRPVTLRVQTCLRSTTFECSNNKRSTQIVGSCCCCCCWRGACARAVIITKLEPTTSPALLNCPDMITSSSSSASPSLLLLLSLLMLLLLFWLH